MKWIDFKFEQPTKEGKYLVKTLTMMKNSNRVEAICTITNDNGKSKVSFNVSNQIVTHWLKEEEV